MRRRAACLLAASGIRHPKVPVSLIGLALVAGLFVALLTAEPAHAADFTVTNTNDSGTGSLRQAITDANDNAGVDTISFNIGGGAGVKTIAPVSALPAATDPVAIDGTTQTGFSGSPVIELNGSGAGPGVDGLAITAGSSMVKGFAINRFSRHGILLRNNGGNTVVGNYVGTDTSGTVDLGNGNAGVEVREASHDNVIGRTAPGEGNVISGNNIGVALRNTERSVVQGNRIGTDAAGAADLGNSSTGVLLSSASGCTVGGAAAGAGNVIAFNKGSGGWGGGVVVLSNSHNSILSNSFFSNSGLGIDLDGDSGGFPLDGVTANDPDDTDSGPNELQNFPVLNSASLSGSTTTVTGTLDTTASTTFRIQFFSSPEADPSGNGEGKTYLGELTDVATDANGDASFSFTTPDAQAGEMVTATATAMPVGPAPVRSTSEFSGAAEVSLTDTVAPGITRVRPKPGARIKDRTPTIKATVKDSPANPTGSNIELYLDGKRRMAFSYDVDTGKLSYRSRKLKPGNHKVKVVARDAAENAAARTWKFKVVR